MPEIIKEKFRKYRQQRLLESYAGNKVFCSICHSSFSAFGSFGLKKRANAVCHSCGSLERHRLVWKYICDNLNILNSGKDLRVLHFAPRKMFYDIFIDLEHVDYYPCDLHPAIYDFGGRKAIIKADITDIPFEANYFDFVLCNHVLEHIPNDGLAMSELYRVMKKNGSGILQVPIDYSLSATFEDFSIIDPAERELAFGQKDHVRWYGRDYISRLKNAGFKVTEDDFVNRFSPEEQFKFGFMDSEMIYFCQK